MPTVSSTQTVPPHSWRRNSVSGRPPKNPALTAVTAVVHHLSLIAVSRVNALLGFLWAPCHRFRIGLQLELCARTTTASVSTTMAVGAFRVQAIPPPLRQASSWPVGRPNLSPLTLRYIV